VRVRSQDPELEVHIDDLWMIAADRGRGRCYTVPGGLVTAALRHHVFSQYQYEPGPDFDFSRGVRLSPGKIRHIVFSLCAAWSAGCNPLFR
jgi:hypothetical protein